MDKQLKCYAAVLKVGGLNQVSFPYCLLGGQKIFQTFHIASPEIRVCLMSAYVTMW